jgi:hypothetical protein
VVENKLVDLIKHLQSFLIKCCIRAHGSKKRRGWRTTVYLIGHADEAFSKDLFPNFRRESPEGVL